MTSRSRQAAYSASGCAALRGDVALLLPGIFFRPFYALPGIM
ncbi:hypothetical protein [Escherichia coli]|nr:hypothetical protein [Escherichia coli]WHF80577.1 hypothetical protein QDX14_26225 [Escherichia coli]